MRRSCLALALLVATACDDDRPTPDAGADDAAVALDAIVPGDRSIGRFLVLPSP